MDDRKRELKGSGTRDHFKWLHKNLLGNKLYALNSDLELVEKYPPFVVARLDFKCLGDSISFAEAVAYNDYIKKLAPVYLVEAQCYPRDFPNVEPEEHRFNIYRFYGADHRPEPPKVFKTLIRENLNWEEYERWEKDMRKFYVEQRKNGDKAA